MLSIPSARGTALAQGLSRRPGTKGSQARARSRMRAARRAATYAGRTTYSTKYMRNRTSPPVSATDASAQSDASIARIRATMHAANATQTGTTTPTRTWSDPGPFPGGFGIEPPAQTPQIGATTRQIGRARPEVGTCALRRRPLLQGIGTRDRYLTRPPRGTFPNTGAPGEPPPRPRTTGRRRAPGG